jgi:hypothetical protein
VRIVPTLNLRKPLYDEIIRHNDDPTEVVNESVAKHIQDEYDVEISL